MRKLGRENGKLTDYFTIITGTLLMAVAANWLYSPANMVPGGFTGLAIILQEMTKGIRPGGVPIWFWNTVLNVPLILLSIRARGWKFMRRTFMASVVFSVWLFLVPEYNLIKGDLLLVSVIGGGIMGAGLGLVFLGKEVGKLFVPQFVYSLVQNPMVSFVAQVRNESALLAAENVAGPADVEVLHGDVDAAAQLRKVFDGLQPPA